VPNSNTQPILYTCWLPTLPHTLLPRFSPFAIAEVIIPPKSKDVRNFYLCSWRKNRTGNLCSLGFYHTYQLLECITSVCWLASQFYLNLDPASTPHYIENTHSLITKGEPWCLFYLDLRNSASHRLPFLICVLTFCSGLSFLFYSF
jgi:hypothetical protein